MLREKQRAAVDRETTHNVADCNASAPDLITENMADFAAPVFVIDMRKPQTFGASQSLWLEYIHVPLINGLAASAVSEHLAEFA